MEVTVAGLPATTLTKEGSMGYTFLIKNTTQDISEEVWNEQIPADNRLMQYDYLRLIETTHKDTLGFRYVLVSKDDTVTGAIYFQIIHFSGRDILNYFPDNLTGWKKYLLWAVQNISGPFIANIKVNMLVSGNIFMTGESGFYFQSGIGLAVQASLVQKAITEINRADKQIKVAVVSDLYEPKNAFSNSLQSSGYEEVALEPDMSIELPSAWNDFNDYLMSLSSKYRVRAKRVLSINKEHQIIQRDLGEAEIERYGDKLYRSYLDIMDKAQFKLGIISKDYFRLQKGQMPQNYFLFAYFQGEELLGFISALLLPGKMHVHYCGVSAEVNRATHLYQRMMYDMLDLGILHRVRLIHFGRTAPEIKSTIGAVPAATFGFVKHFNPIVNFLLIRPFIKYLKPPQYVFRNPFKS